MDCYDENGTARSSWVIGTRLTNGVDGLIGSTDKKDASSESPMYFVRLDWNVEGGA